MLTRRVLWIGLLGAGLLGGVPAGALLPERQTAKLDAQLQTLVEGGSTPGIVVIILRDGQPHFSRGVGVQQPDGQAQIGRDQMFRYASMTKPVTSVAALILVEEGKLGLDEPVSRYLPAFADLKVRQPDSTLAPAARPPTIKELLTHTAGFSYNFINRPGIADAYAQAGVTDGLADPAIATGEAMRRLASAPLAYQPGTEWHYSLATDVLGAVIEQVTGGTLGAFVTERIAKPLQLDSWVFQALTDQRGQFVGVTRPERVTGALGTGFVPVTTAERVPYPVTGGTALLDPERVFSPTAYHSGGGGMSGSARDYARFAQMLLNEGELDGARVLRAETVRQMTANQIGALPVTLRGPGWGFGLGVSMVTDPAAAKTAQPPGSYGWGGIYGTGFWVDPVNGVVGVVMTQTAIIGSGPIANSVREAFYAE